MSEQSSLHKAARCPPSVPSVFYYDNIIPYVVELCLEISDVWLVSVIQGYGPSSQVVQIYASWDRRSPERQLLTVQFDDKGHVVYNHIGTQFDFGSAMNTELLTCRKLTAGLVYPPFALTPPQVNHIYAEITERYPFQNLAHLPDGGRMANPDGDFFIQTSRMQFNGNVDYFEAAKDKAIDLFGIAQARLNIPEFVAFGVKLTAFLPLPEGKNAAEVIERSAFGSIDRDLDILGDGRQGTGLRVVLHNRGICELKIEPLFSDPTQIYIDVDFQHPSPFTNLGAIESQMDDAYKYLFGEVKGFLETF